MYIKVRLENKEGHHNKFYQMTLSDQSKNGSWVTCPLKNPIRIEIHSGRIGVTNVLQEPKDTINGWSTWEEGYRWFVKQLKAKVSKQKEYSLRIAQSDKDHPELVKDAERIAYEFASDAKRTEEAMTYIESKWW